MSWATVFYCIVQWVKICVCVGSCLIITLVGIAILCFLIDKVIGKCEREDDDE